MRSGVVEGLTGPVDALMLTRPEVLSVGQLQSAIPAVTAVVGRLGGLGGWTWRSGSSLPAVRVTA